MKFLTRGRRVFNRFRTPKVRILSGMIMTVLAMAVGFVLMFNFVITVFTAVESTQSLANEQYSSGQWFSKDSSLSTDAASSSDMLMRPESIVIPEGRTKAYYKGKESSDISWEALSLVNFLYENGFPDDTNVYSVTVEDDPVYFCVVRKSQASSPNLAEGVDFSFYDLSENVETAIGSTSGPSEDLVIFFVDAWVLRSFMHIFDAIVFVLTLIALIIASLGGIHTASYIDAQQNRMRHFFQNASHELKTPLMSIQGYAEALQVGAITDVDQATSVIIKQSERMKDLVEELLEISKLESSDYEPIREPVNLSKIVGLALDAIEPLADEHNIFINVDDLSTLPFITGDEHQLRKALTTVLLNSLQYAKTEITVTGSFGRNEAWVQVADDGSGISEKDMPHIFERFYTGDSGNSGIGLSMAAELMSLQGGSIKASNATAGGAVFTFAFRR